MEPSVAKKLGSKQIKSLKDCEPKKFGYKPILGPKKIRERHYSAKLSKSECNSSALIDLSLVSLANKKTFLSWLKKTYSVLGKKQVPLVPQGCVIDIHIHH